MWDAALYDKLSRERMQPSIDLAARFAGEKCDRILDVGCGTGLSTIPLRKQFPDSEIIGVDLSAEMLEKAKTTLADVTWLRRDCSKPLDDLGKFDLVFSNAFLQWLHNQEEFIKNARALLREDGALAMQVPDFQRMPASDCIDTVADQFAGLTQRVGASKYIACLGLEGYYDVLRRYYADVEIWQTNYNHVMADHTAILEFIKGTALRPFLEVLDEKHTKRFLAGITAELKKHYTVREDGNVLFEFKRIFFIARI